MKEPIRVVIADDSPFVCDLLKTYLDSESDLEVVDMVHDGAAAIQAVKKLKPDVVTLDLEMPNIDGLEALVQIMATTPVSAVVITGVSDRAATMTMQAVDFGAVDFVFKYQPDYDIDPFLLRQEIVAKVRFAASVRVVRTVSSPMPNAKVVPTAQPLSEEAQLQTTSRSTRRVIVVGASTGGPMALRELLGMLPTDLQAAILIVQHMPRSFTSALAAQLNRHCPLSVREATDGDNLEVGSVLLAPGDCHVVMQSDSRVALNQSPAINGHRPSIDVAMQSAAQAFGSRATGVLLTGMGSDGAEGMRAIHSVGGDTYAQDESSSVVFGMPQQAISRGVAGFVASPREIGQALSGIVRPDHLEPSIDVHA